MEQCNLLSQHYVRQVNDVNDNLECLNQGHSSAGIGKTGAEGTLHKGWYLTPRVKLE